MTSTHKFLRIMHKLGTENKPVSKVFRRMLDIDLFVAAYTELARNKGRLTPGINGETIDGASVEKLQRLIDDLKEKRFRWTPVRRVYIPKGSGKLRGLGLPSWDDKVVQMVLKMVLEAYYEPQFLNCSHGFRPKRGCHSALVDIRQCWHGTKWFIEGDIHQCFDRISHGVILTLISKRVQDNQLLRLIKDMLKAGYMEDWVFHQTHSGTPQGGVASPLLSNIVLHELDKYVTDVMMPKYRRGNYRKVNPEYSRLAHQAKQLSETGDFDQARMARKQMRQTAYNIPIDANYSRLRYVRYADDIILSWIGSKAEAETIKHEIKEWLETHLSLELSEEKTLITNAKQERARFLGYEIGVIYGDRLETRKAPGGFYYKRKTLNGQIQLYVPRDVRKSWVRKYCRKGKPIHRNTYLRYSDFEIIHAYGSEWRGLVGYYGLASNIHSLREVEWTMWQSCQKTLAGKHKTTSRKIRERYQTRLNGKQCLMCEVHNPKNPTKPLRAMLGGIPLRVRRAVDIDKYRNIVWEPKFGTAELTQRLLANRCELCESTEKVEVHHIKSIKELKARYMGRNMPEWVESMSRRYRNTLVVCRKCHDAIHYGRYDGNSLRKR